MEDYKNKLGNLADKLKKETTPQTPIQQVQPVKTEPVKEEEMQFNNWIPKILLKQVKAYGVEHEMTLKEINIRALKEFLTSDKNDKYDDETKL
ncbi:hypothetical protein [Mucilaginibacter paludis]|uniref:Uncharacterized protein n=1 Tax=Mucilaginibacter paludis DSM 18603 TaxID=714943 RepID=H1YDX8_9SPHI|nr:hypothetical protein [Mucilaginibacter paludis]EHQ24318.1 hypothetical protein Mucpa_0115 [Mucilaginibacter paludis DSM 18603]